MFSRKAEAPSGVQVEVPTDDRPSWVKVGVIAAIGFVVGVAVPRLLGLTMSVAKPVAPASSVAEAPSASGAESAAVPLPPAPVPSATAAAQTMSAAPTIALARGFVLSCKTGAGTQLKAVDCGPFAGLDALAQPRLKKLEKCAAADGVSGKLAVVVNVDFDANRISIEPGKATTIPSPDGLYACAREAFQGAPLAGIDHQHPKYTVLYTATLTAPPSVATAAQAASPAAGEETPGQVVWEVAIVRDAPRSKTQVARLPRGTKVLLGPVKDNWYKIKYGPDMQSEGYVYRGALGK